MQSAVSLIDVFFWCSMTVHMPVPLTESVLPPRCESCGVGTARIGKLPRVGLRPVLLTGMYAMPNLGHDYAEAFKAVFTRLGQRPGVLYDPFFLEGVAAVPSLNQPDRLHPNAEGVRRIVARLLPLVEKLLAEISPA